MDYTPAVDADLYLLTMLRFQVGSAGVTLYGGVRIGDGGFTFLLSDRLNPALALPDPGDATKSISEPFGMTGVTLDAFNAHGRIYRDTAGDTSVDLALNARTTLRKLELTLDGSLVFEKTSPRLVIVTLTADRPLTLTAFITSVLGGSWGWMDDLTSQIAFQTGSMYCLSSKSTFQYQAAGGIATYQPGYHVAAKLRLFETYDFDIELDVDDTAITLAGSIPKLDFDFITFQKPQLNICTKSQSSYFRISTDILLLGTAFASVEADYAVDQKAFGGRVSASFDVDIPAVGTSSHRHVDLAVAFAWTSGAKGGFRITGISGLPANVFDLAAEFENYLNQIKSGGCEKILGDWLKDLCKTSLSPGLNGTPKKQDGQMWLPLKLTYTISLGDNSMSSTIGFTAKFDIPKSLSGLPAAMWGSVVSSVPGIAGDILSNPETYKSLALACAIKYGAAAGARFICRALENFPKDVAQSIADAASQFAASDIAATAELAAAIAGLAVTVVAGILEAFLDFIKNLFDDPLGLKKKAKVDEDNARINGQAQKIRDAMQPVWDSVGRMKSSQPVAALKTRLDSSGNVSATWIPGTLPRLPSGATVTYQLRLLDGLPGQETDTAWPGTKLYTFPMSQTSTVIPIAEIPKADKFQYNSSLACLIAGIVFLTQKTDSDLSSAINSLSGADLWSAEALAAQLSQDLNLLRGYNTDGVRTAPVYAVLDMPSLMTVGQSRIGRNTRICSK